MVLTQAVLTEAMALVSGWPARSRLRALIEAIDPEPCAAEMERQFRTETFNWLEQYSEHDPDWTDAVLAVLAGRFPKWKVWTYDREFATLWRTPAGSHIALATSQPAR